MELSHAITIPFGVSKSKHMSRLPQHENHVPKVSTKRMLKILRHNCQIIKNHVNKDKSKGKIIINIILNVTLVKILNVHKRVKDSTAKIGEGLNFWVYQTNAPNVKSNWLNFYKMSTKEYTINNKLWVKLPSKSKEHMAVNLWNIT